MRKLKLLCAVTATMFILTGCGGSKVAWTPGSILVNDKVVNVTEYSESEAKKEVKGIGTENFYVCDDIDMSPHNVLMIAKEQMSDFKGNKYYTHALDTDFGMYKKVGKQYLEGYLVLEPRVDYTVDQALNELYNTMDSLTFVGNVKTIPLSEKVTLKAESWNWILRPNEVIIPNVLRVKADDGSVQATESETIGKVTVGKKSGQSYDYYLYDGLVIQLTKNQSISEVLSLKE